MADTYTRDRFAWLDQIHKDPELTPLAFKVAYSLSSYLNRETGDAWPSQGRLAEELRISRRGLQNALAELSRRGHLEVEVQRGRGGSNRYRPKPKNAHEAAHPTPENAHQGAHPAEPKCAPECAGGAHETAQGVRTPLRTNLSERTPLSESSERRESPSSPSGRVSQDQDASTNLSEPFEELFAAYPRGGDYMQAKRQYVRIIRRGWATHGELMCAVRSFARTQCGKEPRFIKTLPNWLSQDCWRDQRDGEVIDQAGNVISLRERPTHVQSSTFTERFLRAKLQESQR